MKIYGNRHIIDLTAQMISKGREPHSLIIHGEKGLGKKALARYIASQLMCEEKRGVPCGKCRACRMIDHGAHPDLIFAKSNEKGNYFVDDIREQIVSDAVVMPNEGDIKVYVIPDFDLSVITSVQVQNILLKLIEEPPAHTAVILTARSKEIFLPTIISRCLSFAAVAVSDGESAEYLQENFPDATAVQIADAVRAGHGNIGRCREYLEQGEFFTAANEASKLARAYCTRNEYELLKVLSGLTKKNELRQCVYLFSEIVRDAAVHSAGSEGELISCDPAAAKELSGLLTPAMGWQLYDLLCREIKKLDSNCNVSLTANDLCALLVSGR